MVVMNAAGGQLTSDNSGKEQYLRSHTAPKAWACSYDLIQLQTPDAPNFHVLDTHTHTFFLLQCNKSTGDRQNLAHMCLTHFFCCNAASQADAALEKALLITCFLISSGLHNPARCPHLPACNRTNFNPARGSGAGAWR